MILFLFLFRILLFSVLCTCAYVCARQPANDRICSFYLCILLISVLFTYVCACNLQLSLGLYEIIVGLGRLLTPRRPPIDLALYTCLSIIPSVFTEKSSAISSPPSSPPPLPPPSLLLLLFPLSSSRCRAGTTLARG